MGLRLTPFRSVQTPWPGPYRSAQDGEGQDESQEEMEIDPAMFSKLEHTAIILTILLDDDQNIRVLGLVLAKLDGDAANDTKYERAGFFRFFPMHSSKFETWISGWTQQTITVI